MEKRENIKAQLEALLKIEPLDSGAIFKLSRELSKFDPHHQRFAVDAKTLIHLGRDSIKDHTTALIELVKNSYDADAQNVKVEIFCNQEQNVICVSDNGFGMTRDELLNGWLRIGFSNKRKSKNSRLERRRTGEKGIGRISTDRLGAKLELITKTKKDGLIGLKVNWDEFDTEGKDIFDIEVELTQPVAINIPAKAGKESDTGTEIRITELRQVWNAENIENLYYELSSFTPPFHDVKDFEIELSNDITVAFSKKVNPLFYQTAVIELTTIFDGTDTVTYEIKDKYSDKPDIATIKLHQFMTKAGSESKNLSCGALEVRLMFFLRVGASVRDTNFKLNDLLDFLDNNMGVKIYRDKVSVKPYGFPKAQLGYDWLGIGERKASNPAGVGRDDYRVSPNQIVGAVFIGRDDNPKLTDSAAREGLVESEAFYDMKDFVIASLRLLETHRSKIYSKEKGKNDKQNTAKRKDAEQITKKLTDVKNELSLIKTDIEKKGDQLKVVSLIKPIQKTIGEVETISEDVNTVFSELLDWQRVLGGLATMGISSAVFGHETEGSIIQIKGSVTEARASLVDNPPDIVSALEELDKAIKSSKRVAAWGAYALTRVQREKRVRRDFQINKAIQAVVKELKPAFEASTIEVKVEGEKVYSKTYQMDIESIIVNLLTNAYTFSLKTDPPRKVRIHIASKDKKDKQGFTISVSDSGPGVAKQYVGRIFEPLFSTKTSADNSSKSVGTGLGLTIVKSIVDDLNGDIKVDSDPSLKGARFQIWLPKEV